MSGHVRDLLARAAAGDLEPEEQERVDAHLAGCPEWALWGSYMTHQ